MTLLFFALAGALLIVLQTTLLMPTPIWWLAPDFYFIFIAYLAYSFTLLPALILVYLTGLMLDVLSGTTPGIFTALCFSGFFVLRLLAAKIKPDEYIYSIPPVALVFLALSFLCYSIFNFFHPGQLAPWEWRTNLIRTALIAFFTYPLFHLFKKLKASSEAIKSGWRSRKQERTYRPHT